MKIDRLINIIFLFLQKERVTSRSLADRFGCSQRTIYRDIESLERAGLPIISYQGQEGGYELVECYKLDKSFLISREASTLLGILNGLRKVIDDHDIDNLTHKLSTSTTDNSNIYFDMSGWGMSKKFKNKVNTINDAITHSRNLRITYHSSYREITHRKIHPLKLIVKGSSWYLFSFCLLKKEYRLFKILRIVTLEILEERFEKSNYKTLPESYAYETSEETERIVLKYDKRAYSHYKDFFLEENITKREEEYFIVEVDFPIDYWVAGMVLSFGDMVEVLEPRSLRQFIKREARKIRDRYE